MWILFYKMIYISMSSLTIAFIITTAIQASAEKPVYALKSEQCIRLIACFEATGEYFRGGTQSEENGSIYAKSALGPECVRV